MRLSLPVLLASLLTLSACGGGGGSSSSSSDGGGATPASGPVSLGTVIMPGVTLTATRTSALVPGATATFRVTSSDPGIASLEVLIGVDWETAQPATVVTTGAGIWDATVTLPNPLPAEAAMLVRITGSDGNVCETSRTVYRL